MIAPAGKLACPYARTLMSLLPLRSTTYTASAQTTIGTGSVVGIVSDPSGAVISGARVTIPSIRTRQVVRVSTNSSGWFNSGVLGRHAFRIIQIATIDQPTDTSVPSVSG
jgi:hypothetical protein